MKLIKKCQTSRFGILALFGHVFWNALMCWSTVSTTTVVEAWGVTQSASSARCSTRLHVDGKGMAGGSQHMLGDILRSLQPRYLSLVRDALESNVQGMRPVSGVDVFCAKLHEEGNILSWEALQDQVKVFGEQTESPSVVAKATQRLFGYDMQPTVTLYRDSAAWCPYCQKVWMALEEKEIPYEVIKIDMRCYGKGKPTEFLQLQPNGNLPCAIVHNGTEEETVIRESNDIIDALDDLAESLKTVTGKFNRRSSKIPTLRPAKQEERIRDLCDNGRESLERRLYARWMWWLTGVRRPQEYQEIFLEHWQEMEVALGEDKSGPYFLGKDLSVVDLRFIPFVERQLASLTYFKGANYLRDPKQFPNIVRWLKALESRPSYQATKSDYYTHSRALPPQLAAECVTDTTICPDDALRMQAAIDDMPMGAGNLGWVEPGWEWYTGNPSHEAALALIQGSEKIVAFSARGAGLAGLPAASAPLSDPSATPNSDIIPAIDVLFRLVASNLLSKKSNKPQQQVLEQAIMILDEETVMAIVECLDYFRARIGVPRDISYPAAESLRTELVQLSRQLLAASALPEKTAVESLAL